MWNICKYMYFLKKKQKNHFSLFYLTFFDRPAPNYDSDCTVYSHCLSLTSVCVSCKTWAAGTVLPFFRLYQSKSKLIIKSFFSISVLTFIEICVHKCNIFKTRTLNWLVGTLCCYHFSNFST
jgi:hypothetical protein